MAAKKKMVDMTESEEAELSPAERRGCGWKASPATATDQHFAARIGLSGLGPPPAAVDSRQLVRSVLDQGRAESCIANAGAQQIRCAMVNQGQQDPPLVSQQFCYYGLRLLEGTPIEDGGGYVRNFYRAVNRFGFCSARTLPYDPRLDHINLQPTEAAYMEAFENRIQVGYYRIDFGAGAELSYQRKLAIQQALAAGHTVLFGTAVDLDTFPKVNSLELQEAPPLTATVGGHAMLVVGYDASGVTIVNSWGTGWGQDGFGRLSWDYMLDPRTSDLWVLEVITAPKFYESAP